MSMFAMCPDCGEESVLEAGATLGGEALRRAAVVDLPLGYVSSKGKGEG